MSYPAWWTDTVTLYHRTISNNAATWKRTVLNGCYFSNSGGNTGGDEPRTGNRTFVRIPVTGAKPKLAIGDIIAYGVLKDAIDDYANGQRSTDFLASHIGTAFCVKELRDNAHKYIPSPHIYAGGD